MLGLDPVSLVAATTYALVLLAAFGEAIPIVGFLVPGHLIVITAGAAAAAGRADPWIVLLVASGGAILGDLASYSLGRRYGAGLLARFEGKLGLSATRVDAARTALRRNPFVTIVVGRFNSFTRSIAPFAAGAAEFPRVRFAAYNAIGGIAWAASAVGLGFVFGQGFLAAQAVAGKVVAVLLVALLCVLVGVVALRRLDGRITRAEAAWLLVSVVALTGFLLVAEGVTEGEGLSQYDAAVASFVQAHATGGVFELLDTVSEWGTTLPVLGALIAVGVLLWRDGQPRESIRVLVLGALALMIVEILKLLVARPRPMGAFDAGYSFPSGHTTFAALLACLIAWYAARRYAHRFVVVGTLALAATWVSLMAVSRIALRAHYATDVLAGACLGIAIAGGGLAGPSIALRLAERRSTLVERLPRWLHRRGGPPLGEAAAPSRAEAAEAQLLRDDARAR